MNFNLFSQRRIVSKLTLFLKRPFGNSSIWFCPKDMLFNFVKPSNKVDPMNFNLLSQRRISSKLTLFLKRTFGNSSIWFLFKAFFFNFVNFMKVFKGTEVNLLLNNHRFSNLSIPSNISALISTNCVPPRFNSVILNLFPKLNGKIPKFKTRTKIKFNKLQKKRK